MAFLRAARKDEIPTGSIREFQVNGATIALANVDGNFYAIATPAYIAGARWARASWKAK